MLHFCQHPSWWQSQPTAHFAANRHLSSKPIACLVLANYLKNAQV
ncbi:hypothetical protein [Moraxella cuniculi]|nr:hypothetical protein [Moraxella cuniculi]